MKRRQEERDALIIANARRMMKACRQSNRYLYSELFGTGSATAGVMCIELGLDPESNETSYTKMMDHIEAKNVELSE